jgi:hypothetical protein
MPTIAFAHAAKLHAALLANKQIFLVRSFPLRAIPASYSLHTSVRDLSPTAPHFNMGSDVALHFGERSLMA